MSIIAGQSNAQGGFGILDNGVDDRMDAVRVSNQLIPASLRTDPTKLPSSYREVQELVSTKNSDVIGPLGTDLWYWGRVGAKLARECQAPVAFFNAALGGTTITNWATSTDPGARASGKFDPATPTDLLAGRFFTRRTLRFLRQYVSVLYQYLRHSGGAVDAGRNRYPRPYSGG